MGRRSGLFVSYPVKGYPRIIKSCFILKVPQPADKSIGLEMEAVF